MDPSAGHQQPTSPLAAAGGAAAYYPPPPGPAATAAAPPVAASYYPPPPQAAAGAEAAAAGQPAPRPHYAAAAGAGAAAQAAPAAAAPAPAVAPAVGSKRSYDDSGAGAAADGYGQAVAADASTKRQQLDAATAAPAAAAPAAAASTAPAVGGRPSAASIPRESIYRLVLDVVDTALIIGRGGNTVRSIEQATGAAAGVWSTVGACRSPLLCSRAICWRKWPAHLAVQSTARQLDTRCRLTHRLPPAGGRIKRLQEPPGAREQTLVIWSNSRELPAPNRMGRNTAQVRGLSSKTACLV